MSMIFISPRRPLHQRRTRSGVVHARYTRCRGASNSRVTRICSSVGSVTVADPLVTAITFLLLEFVEHVVEGAEALRPRAFVGLDPVVDGLERAAVEAVEPLAALVAHLDGADLAEHPQVLGHLRLRQAEEAHEVVHRALAAGERVEDLAPPGLGHRVERVCRGRWP